MFKRGFIYIIALRMPLLRSLMYLFWRDDYRISYLVWVDLLLYLTTIYFLIAQNLFLQKDTHLKRQKGFIELPRALFWYLLCSESACPHYLSSGKTVKYFTANTKVIHKFRCHYHMETTILYKVHLRCKQGFSMEKWLFG